jgi:hypothetical protein
MGLAFAGAIVGNARLSQAAPPAGKPAPLVQTIGVLSVQFSYERTDKTDESSDGASAHTVESWSATGSYLQRVMIQPIGEIPSSMAFALGHLPATDPSPDGNKQAEYSGHYTYLNEHHEHNGSYGVERRFANFDIKSTSDSNRDAIHVLFESFPGDDNDQCFVRMRVEGNYTVKSQRDGANAVSNPFDSPVKLVPYSQHDQASPIDLHADHEFDPAVPLSAPAMVRRIHEMNDNRYGTFPQALSCSGAKTLYSPKGGWALTFSLSQKNPNSKTTSANGRTTIYSGSEKITLVVRLIPGNPAPAKMIIEPNDSKAYDEWAPIPASDDPQVQKVYGDTDRLSFTATIKAKEQGRQPPPGTIDFYLRDVSHNTGKCGNDPRSGGGDSGSPPVGLRFAKSQPSVIVDAADPTHAYTANLVTSATVIVEATDAGAYGKLYAESQELGLAAVYERTNQVFVPVPRDDDDNHVAYAWEKAQGINGKHLAANSDDEDQPYPNHKGDGLSLYDQYRGFVMRLDDGKGNPIKRHQRINVKSKNVFVRVREDDTAAALLRQSVQHFGKITGFAIHFIYDDTGLNFDDEALGKSPYPHWLNYNSDPTLAADGCPRQYAIWIMSKPPPGGNVYGRTVPIPPFNESDPETPKNVDYIGVYRDNAKARLDKVIADYPTLRQVAATKPDYYSNTRKAWDELHAAGQISDDFPAIAQYTSANESALIDQFVEFCIIHEMSHATGVQHHHLKDALAAPPGQEMKFFAMGNADCPMRYWADDLKSCLLEFDGKWAVTNAPDGTDWKFCEEECQNQFHVRD